MDRSTSARESSISRDSSAVPTGMVLLRVSSWGPASSSCISIAARVSVSSVAASGSQMLSVRRAPPPGTASRSCSRK